MRPKTTPGAASLTRTRRRLAPAGPIVALTATLAGVAPVAWADTYSCSGRQYYLYDLEGKGSQAGARRNDSSC
ncbi:hypothetical protein [Streptomyces albicerus]|uniref:hypothetical protein n=1 Tax=Streptomyces albicerus TaxID=2569859 RepID=UPI00124AF5D3|nr:hypothetical protein [Streptomyces albicerus]